jgi:penicillin-binding protein-related factor A (putative recombinase)
MGEMQIGLDKSVNRETCREVGKDIHISKQGHTPYREIFHKGVQT